MEQDILRQDLLEPAQAAVKCRAGTCSLTEVLAALLYQGARTHNDIYRALHRKAFGITLPLYASGHRLPLAHAGVLIQCPKPSMPFGDDYFLTGAPDTHKCQIW